MNGGERGEKGKERGEERCKRKDIYVYIDIDR